MDDNLEQRLRRDLSGLDQIDHDHGPAAAMPAIRSAERRLRARRRLTSGVAATVIAVAGVGAVISFADRDTTTVSSPNTSPTDEPSSTVAASVEQPAAVATPSPWTTIAPDPRGPSWAPAAVWTGTEAIVFAGTDFRADGSSEPRDGVSAYNPATDTWRRLSDAKYPLHNTAMLTAWTGSTVLALGGDLNDSMVVSALARYDVASDTWTYGQSPPGFVSSRSPSAWTGTELLVWPSSYGTDVLAPSAYDPATDSWRTLATPPIQPRELAASVWTGSSWIIWGGSNGDDDFADGATYDPATDTWTRLPVSPLSPRWTVGVWTGTEMVVLAGASGGSGVRSSTTGTPGGGGTFAFNDGAAYNPATQTWRRTATGLGHPGGTALWTGTSVLVFAKGNAAAYDPAANTWNLDCCPRPDNDGSVGTSTAMWIGDAALMIGSIDAVGGGAILRPGVEQAGSD